MPLLYLVRHGQASFGAARYDVLSQKGKEQAILTGQELARRKPRDPVVVCGTLERQRDTATHLIDAADLAAEVHIDARWNEFDVDSLVERYAPGRGPRTQLSSVDIQRTLDQALLGWITDAESDGWSAFAGGANAALSDLLAGLAPGRDAIVVTSGGILAAVCAALLSASPDGIVALNRVMVNAAITTLTSGSSGINLLTLNDHAHFTGGNRELLTYR